MGSRWIKVNETEKYQYTKRVYNDIKSEEDVIEILKVWIK